MVKIPEFKEEDYAQICFVKKYGRKKDGKNVTNYSFFKIGIRKEISKEVKEWVKQNFKKIKKEKIIDYNPSVELEDLERIDLKKLEAWNKFEQEAFDGINFRAPELNKLKSNLIAVIIFVKTINNYYGQIKRIFPGNILNQKGLYNLYFNGEEFNDLREESGLRLYKSADFIFCSDDKGSEGIVLNKENFNKIFDLWEEYKKRSLENAKEVKLFAQSQYFNSFCVVINEDKQIQKMLMNPVFENYLNEIGYGDLAKLKRQVPGLNFELDDKQKDFILPKDNEKEAIRDLIKVISGRFGRSINNKHVVENSGIKRVLK